MNASKRPASASPITLAVDIGGSGLKAMLLDSAGKPVSERVRVETPAIPTPLGVLKRLDKLTAQLPRFDRVAVGFPGVIKQGVTWTAVNLHPLGLSLPRRRQHQEDRNRTAQERQDRLERGRHS